MALFLCKYLEFKLGENHAAGSDTVDIDFLIPGDLVIILLASFALSSVYIPLESEDVKGFVHDLHFLLIIDGINLDLAETAGRVICEQIGSTLFIVAFKSLP